MARQDFRKYDNYRLSSQVSGGSGWVISNSVRW